MGRELDRTKRDSLILRELGIDRNSRKVRLARFEGTQQSKDLTIPSNCQGFGRIHHFRRFQGEGWPLDPLPIDPALHALGLPDRDEITAEVFQIAVCNLRCWYCYVDRNLIIGDPSFSAMVGAQELLDLYLTEKNRPPVMDLSGGQPDLVPEWALWVADTIHTQGLEKEIYLWSDDNLVADHLWRFLDAQETQRLASYKNYGRVGCFKGFDERSFAFNTGCSPDFFGGQFSLMRKLVDTGFDVYGYITLTSDQEKQLASRITGFIDRLQTEVHPLFPLRTIPQRIIEFSPTKERMGIKHQKALEIQNEAVYLWQTEIEKRFPQSVREKRIYEHDLRSWPD